MTNQYVITAEIVGSELIPGEELVTALDGYAARIVRGVTGSVSVVVHLPANTAAQASSSGLAVVQQALAMLPGRAVVRSVLVLTEEQHRRRQPACAAATSALLQPGA